MIIDEKEQPKRPFTRSSNTTTSGNTTARPSDVNVVTTTTKTANPFASTNPQTSNNQARSQRVFTLLYMPLFKALGVLIKKGHLKSLEQRPLPDPLSPKHKITKYCVFHQQHGHDTDQYYRLRHEIQDLIDSKVITPYQKPNVTTNLLPARNQVPPPQHLNLIHTLAISYDLSVYITSSHLPKPAVFILESTNLCMMDASTLQPEPRSGNNGRRREFGLGGECQSIA